MECKILDDVPRDGFVNFHDGLSGRFVGEPDWINPRHAYDTDRTSDEGPGGSGNSGLLDGLLAGPDSHIRNC